MTEHIEPTRSAAQPLHAVPREDTLIDDRLFEAIHRRADRYDRENAFFDEDLADLRGAGYLRGAVPEELGGLGRGFVATILDQQRLAQAAPGTAIAINMHVLWALTALYLRRLGDHSYERLLEREAAGELYAFGFAEPGNNVTPRFSRTKAHPDGRGGYRFEGVKIFTSLSPAWTRLGIFGVDDETDPEHPQIIHAFIPRDAAGLDIRPTWDTVGLRASQSWTTVLDGVPAPAEGVVRRIPQGAADDLTIGNTIMFGLTVSAVYIGVAERAVQLAAEAARRPHRPPLADAAFSIDSFTRVRLAEAYSELDALRLQLRHLAGRVDAVARLTPAFRNSVIGLKVRATEGAQRIVGKAIRVVGGGSFSNGNELSRLYRDVLGGIFHPAQEETVIDGLAAQLLDGDTNVEHAVDPD